MDEVVFRTSQKVDNLQYQIRVAANEGKNAMVLFSGKVKDATLQALENPKYSRMVDSAKHLIVVLLKFHKECKEYILIHYHPKILLRKALKLLGRNFSKRDLLIGGAGIVVGALIGFCISYTIPRTQETLRGMQAIQCLKYSGIEAVVVVEDALGPRECGKNEVLVNVKATSLNSIDVEICNGYGAMIRRIAGKFYKHYKGELPITLGRDCAGVVVDIGKNVSRLEIGDEVWLTTAFWAPGTMSEYIAVAEDKVSQKPKTAGFEGAASLPYCGSTALSALLKADLNSENAYKKNVFVHGGCTAIGCILVQILVAWGAKVTASCYKRAIPVAKALGVEDIIGLSPLQPTEINFYNEDSSLLKKELHYREKFDAIITTTSCELDYEELQAFCKSNGTIISTLPQPLGSDSCSYFTRSMYSLHYKISSYIQKMFTGTLNNFGEDRMCYHMLDDLRQLVENGKLQTVVDRVFQPHDIERAMDHIQSSNSIGSTVITFR